MSQTLDAINQQVKYETSYRNIYSLFYLEKIKVNFKMEKEDRIVANIKF
jgi:hypothetical protein